jgi:hypothetical protein
MMRRKREAAVIRTGLLMVVLAWSAASIPVCAQTSDARDLAALGDRSADLANSYLRLWSESNEAALADVHEIYAPRVKFFGRAMDRRSLAAEKKRFVRRWPIRTYAHRPGTMRVQCNPTTRACVVKSIIDWKAAAPQRGAVSSGASRFELGVDFSGPQPLVLYENGRVISRRRS